MNLLSNVQEQLACLSMKHASRELESVLEKARQEDWTPLQSLQALLSIEQQNRQDADQLRRLRAANLPFHKTLDDFDFGFQTSVSKRQMQQLTEMVWLEGAYNVMFLGPPGVGNYRKYLVMERFSVAP
ncbi:MAG: ATP-binding protein [Desulfocucumaceae bacterium]